MTRAGLLLAVGLAAVALVSLPPAKPAAPSKRPGFIDVAGKSAHPAMRTSRLRGPCTPSTRVSSMSDVADGPEMSVSGTC